MRNAEVCYQWFNGLSGKSDNGNLSTDGHNLYSYQMLIGITTKDNEKHVLNVRGEFRYSVTTSQHVGLAARWGKLVNPIVRAFWRYFPPEILENRKGE